MSLRSESNGNSIHGDISLKILSSCPCPGILDKAVSVGSPIRFPSSSILESLVHWTRRRHAKAIQCPQPGHVGLHHRDFSDGHLGPGKAYQSYQKRWFPVQTKRFTQLATTNDKVSVCQTWGTKGKTIVKIAGGPSGMAATASATEVINSPELDFFPWMKTPTTK